MSRKFALTDLIYLACKILTYSAMLLSLKCGGLKKGRPLFSSLLFVGNISCLTESQMKIKLRQVTANGALS